MRESAFINYTIEANQLFVIIRMLMFILYSEKNVLRKLSTNFNLYTTLYI